MKYFIALLYFFFALFALSLFPSAVNAGGGTACNNWVCGAPVCSPQTGGCTTDCYCADSGSGGATFNCGSGYYVCNSTSGGIACCPIGGGGSTGGGGGQTGETYYGPNCPANSVINLNSPVAGTSRCTAGGHPVSLSPWWGGKDRYILGDSERVTNNCCDQRCVEVCEWVYKPAYKDKPSGGWYEECHDDCTCRAINVVQYACDPLAPPIVVNTAFSSSGNTMGCTASPGYVGKNANNVVRMTVTAPNTYSNGDVSDIRSWFGGSEPAVELLSTTNQQSLVRNGEFGVMVKKVGGVWSDLYAPSRYNGSTSGSTIQSWVRIGSVSEGGIINGANNQPMARVSNIAVTASGTNTVLTYDLSFYSDNSGIPSYETATNKSYAIVGAARYSNTTGNTPWVASSATFAVDLISPTEDSMNFSIIDNTTVDLAWTFTDVDPIGNGNGIVRVLGNAKIEKAGKVNGTINRTSPTPATTGYVLGSVPETGNIYTSTGNLWSINVRNRTERIDLGVNEGGSLDFYAYVFDKACNSVRGSEILPLGDPWLITKAGINYSAGGTSFEMKEIAYTSLTERLSADTYWDLPYAMYKSDADLSTEVLSTSSSMLNNLLYSTRLNSTRLMNKNDSNNREGYWYTRLAAKSAAQIASTPDNFVELNMVGANTTLPARSTLISDGTRTCNDTRTCTVRADGVTVVCENTKSCVVKVAGNLSVNSGHVCNARTLFLVEGDVTINPDVTANSIVNGCMFIVKGDVNITEGTYKSATFSYPKFDLIDAFIISDGNMTIEEVDTGSVRKDGLKVTGSLMAFGREGSRSFILDRGLSLLDSNSYPSLAVHFDYRYLNFATKFFGGDTDGFKKEVGFKPL